MLSSHSPIVCPLPVPPHQIQCFPASHGKFIYAVNVYFASSLKVFIPWPAYFSKNLFTLRNFNLFLLAPVEVVSNCAFLALLKIRNQAVAD